MSKYPKIGIRPTIDGRQGGVRESLEEKTMNLAKAVAELISANVKHADGTPVECVIADGTIGRVAETAACQAKFEREGVGATISVTSCWCYGSETMDMHPHWPKAVWGFNGTERPGAVYLAAVLAGHAQKGLPAFGIYGHDVQDLTDNSIPEDVAEKILRWARAALAVATMRGESYLSVGSQCMGIAGSIVDQNFFQEYLGMRNESVDETEILRRMDEGIYDHEEYAKAMAWTEKYCKVNEGWDKNRPEKQKDRAGKDADWEFVVKMTLIVRDLMLGNPKLREMGFKEEAIGHNAIAAGFQGQRQWTDWKPNGDFTEALLCSTFDWNGIREAYVVATENDACNAVAMLFGKLLTGCGQMFSDVRTYWSPEAVKRVTGKELTGLASDGMIHLINSGATTLDATGARRPRLLPWRWFLFQLPVKGRHARYHVTSEPHQGSWSRPADCRGMDSRRGSRDTRGAEHAYRPHMAHNMVRAPSGRNKGSLQGCLFSNEQLGCQPRCHQLRTHRCRPHHTGFNAPHPRVHAQCARGEHLPSRRMERIRHGQGGC